VNLKYDEKKNQTKLFSIIKACQNVTGWPFYIYCFA